MLVVSVSCLSRFSDLFSANQACKGNRNYQLPRIGVADDKVAQYASLHYYVDKDLQVFRENYQVIPSKVRKNSYPPSSGHNLC